MQEFLEADFKITHIAQYTHIAVCTKVYIVQQHDTCIQAVEAYRMFSLKCHFFELDFFSNVSAKPLPLIYLKYKNALYSSIITRSIRFLLDSSITEIVILSALCEFFFFVLIYLSQKYSDLQKECTIPNRSKNADPVTCSTVK